MSVRPIDVTITVQRTPEVNRSQTGESVRPEVAHQQFTDKLQKDVQQQDQQVMHTNKAEENTVNRDGRGNSGGGQDSKRKKKGNNDGKPKPSQTGSSSMFDVSI